MICQFFLYVCEDKMMNVCEKVCVLNTRYDSILRLLLYLSSKLYRTTLIKQSITYNAVINYKFY